MSRASRRSERVLKGMKQITPKVTPVATNIVFPNYSGTKREPVEDKQLATKKYVDDNAGGTPEGTAVKSTGELITTYLRADGDGTCSWQTPAAGGDVTAGVNLTDETLVQGDGGAKGIKTTTVTAAEVADNTTARHASGSDDQAAGDFNHNDLANLNAGDNYEHLTAAQVGALHASGSDDQAAGDFNHNDLANLNAGDNYEHLTAAQVGALHAIYTDAAAVAAVATADKYLKNDAADVSSGQITATEFVDSSTSGTSTEWEAAYNHSQDNTQAHSDYLLNSAADAGVGLTLSGDNSSADTAYVPMILYNTDGTPPAASGFPVGTLYIQYTA